MVKSIVRNDRLKSTGACVGAFMLCFLVLVWVMRLWEADLKVPFAYGQDALYNGMVIKGIIDNGWYLHNNFIGMPTGLEMYDFNNNYFLHFLTIKIISIFFSDYAVTMNLFYLISFPLTMFTAYIVFRQFQISYLFSTFGSLLFAFLPYHFFRGEQHLLLAAYYTVPLIVMVVLWLCAENPLLFNCDQHNKKLISIRFDARLIIGIFICLLVASTGIYYAFFACFFLLIGGIAATVRWHKIHNLLSALVLIGVIFFGVIANLSPSLVYKYKHGDNVRMGRRNPIESEILGMKINQLLLPTTGHAIPYLAKLKDKYNKRAPLVNENDASSLGVVGSLGFFVLIAALVFRRQQNKNELIYNLSILNIFAVLLATIGGFGSVFAFVVFPQIRAYNRISVFIAFFSLFVIIILMQHYYDKYAKIRHFKVFFSGFVWVVLFIGIIDQTSCFVARYSSTQTEYLNDATFVRKIESLMPGGSMIFQMPYVPFPEALRIHNLENYDLSKGYLHSKTLRWSFGVMKGREGDNWQRSITEKPLNEFLTAISAAGFSGIYIDRNGYEDGAKKLESKLSQLLNQKAVKSANDEQIFFDIREYTKSKYPLYKHNSSLLAL